MTTVVVVLMWCDRGYLLRRVASANARVLKESLLRVSQLHSSDNFCSSNNCRGMSELNQNVSNCFNCASKILHKDV